MGRQWNQIIESLGPLTGGTISINANLTDIDALLTTLQADVADGVKVDVRDGAGNSITSTTAGTKRSLDVTANVSVPSGLNSNIFDGAGNALTSSSRGSERALSVQVVDGSGNQITTFGGAMTSGTISTGTIAQITTATAALTGGTLTTGTIYASITGGTITSGTIAQLTSGTVSSTITGGTITTGTIAQLTDGTVTTKPIRGSTTIGTLTAGTTNGTLFATNSTRNYLLVQCTSGTAYLDTNGTATAGDGILLTTGQGITFEGSFIPTGAIAVITSAGTASIIGRQG